MRKKQASNYEHFFELLKDDNFTKLRQLTTMFNIFEVLRSTHTEIRHSNILAWLLNPYENHGCGDAFLKQLLLTISQRPVQDGLGFSDLYMLEIESVRIKREWKQTDEDSTSESNTNEELDDQEEPNGQNDTQNSIDVLIDLNLKHELMPIGSGQKYTRIVIPIENKIRSKEYTKNGNAQLKTYSNCLTETFSKKKNVKVIPVFLTLDGSDPSDKNWIILKYEDINNIISTVFEEFKGKMGQYQQMMVEQYRDLLGKIIGTGSYSAVMELCWRLGNKHPQAMFEIVKETSKKPVKKTLEHHLCQKIRNDNYSIFSAYINWQDSLRYSISVQIEEWMKQNENIYGFKVIKNVKTSVKLLTTEMETINQEVFHGQDVIILFFDNPYNKDLGMVTQLKEYKDDPELRKGVYRIFYENELQPFGSKEPDRITEKFTQTKHVILKKDEMSKLTNVDDMIEKIKTKIDEYFKGEIYTKIKDFMKNHLDEFRNLKNEHQNLK